MTQLTGRAKQILGPSTVVGILGRRRQGKTLFGAYLCANAHKAGVRVMHNGPLNFGELVDLDELIELGPDLQDALIFLDEVHTLLDSTRGNSLVSYLLSHGLVQLGHRRVWLIWTSQDESMIGRRLKWQTDVAIWVGSKDEGRTVRFAAYHQGSIGPKGFVKRGTLHRANRFWDLYDTTQIIESAPALNMTRQRLEQKQALADLNKARALVKELSEAGHERVTSGQFALYLAGTYGVELSPERVGRMLSSLGLPQRRTGQGRFYDLTSQVV